MNRKRLLRVADVIAPLPYDTKRDGEGKPEAFNMSCGCGSSCCIAGWTGEVFGLGKVSIWAASITLELDCDQADALFRPPGYSSLRYDGERAAQVLRLVAAAGDDVTEVQIRAFWRDPWA